MLNLNIGKIRNVPGAKAAYTVIHTPDAAACGYPDVVFAKPLLFEGQADNMGDGVMTVTGHYSGLLHFVCSRCNERIGFAVSGDYAADYCSVKPGESIDDLEEEDLCFHGDMIDITPGLLREIYLELPMKPLCRDDCRGLCPICGVNLNQNSCSCGLDNIDPRWEKLKYLLDKEKGV